MQGSRKLPSKKVADILNRMAEGGSYRKIGNDTGVMNSTVFSLAKDFPLWAWFKENTRGNAE
jgi:hypothetical protein